MRIPAGLIGAALLVFAGGAAACGGDDGDGGGGGETLSAAELVREANAICADADADVEAVFAELPQGREPAPEEIQEVITGLIPLVEDVSGDLDDLRPPPELKERYDDAISLLKEGNAKVRQAGESPEAASRIFATDDDPYDEANAIFDDLGLTDCGGGGAGDGGGAGG